MYVIYIAAAGVFVQKKKKKKKNKAWKLFFGHVKRCSFIPVKPPLSRIMFRHFLSFCTFPAAGTFECCGYFVPLILPCYPFLGSLGCLWERKVEMRDKHNFIYIVLMKRPIEQEYSVSHFVNILPALFFCFFMKYP